jgi:hypothetical protein
VLIVVCLFFASCSAQKGEQAEPASPQINGVKPIVLVELFTSEGCSSCPPADQALAYLAMQELADVELVTLALHVDYWDSRAWRDKFSSHAYTERQQEYARRFRIGSTYTPQMVVDGQTEFVGSDLRKATAAIGQVVKAQKGRIEAVFDGRNLSIKITDLPQHDKASVYIAVTESELVSDVKGGENDGRRIEHSSVVRSLTQVGSIDAKNGSSDLTTDVKIDPAWKTGNLKIIVFVQEDKSRKIIAVGKAAK